MWWAICLLAALPLVDLFSLTLLNRLGANPQETLLRATGTWTLTLLIAALALGPLARVIRWPELIRLRRMVGLWAFGYGVIHLLGFWAFEHDFIWADVLHDAFKRPFVTVGLLALAMMSALAVTSTDAAMRAMGRNWKRLHQMIYLIAPLACLHFYLHRAGKNNFTDPNIALALVLVFLLFKANQERIRARSGR